MSDKSNSLAQLSLPHRVLYGAICLTIAFFGLLLIWNASNPAIVGDEKIAMTIVGLILTLIGCVALSKSLKITLRKKRSRT